ncbi:OmpA family protein [Muriicola marianensis]|uniref:OmpA-like domain-containing protein n=1 Tax=Muriicola marianensis TaxID=1324801 RepID=A0ABQ1R1F8_9FLAO|nr:OmpA family protein [Muriicola marianensis]GGD54677.1 hypothetical protein GCM10011361_21520 [Muriicola marianensis]
MRTITGVLVTVVFISFSMQLDAQILKKMKDKVVNKVEKGVEKKLENKPTPQEQNDGNPENTTEQGIPDNEFPDHKPENVSVNETTSYKSKFDFIPGDQLVIWEDFSQDAIGDFPALWFTNGSGEVVNIEGFEGKWLMLKDNSNYFLDRILGLPENYTIQFDLICSIPFEWSSASLNLHLLDVIDINRYREGRNGGEMSESNFRNGSFKFDIHPGLNDASTKAYGHYNGFTQQGNLDFGKSFVPAKGKNKVTISIWRQKERIRFYLNENKILDLPKVLPSGFRTTVVQWSVSNLYSSNYFLGNIRMASGAPDTRNKLLTEGKLVTNGIYFGVNSDQIKPESYGVLKDISIVLKDSNAKVIIVGHTDSDGDESSNLDLSRRRAEAVKQALSKDFGVNSSMMEVDGKGESEPIEANNTTMGKAKNRRVEFIKTGL